MIKKLNTKHISYLLLFAFIFTIIFMAPITHDDWSWFGHSTLNSAFKFSLELWKTFNGRILGSTLVYYTGSHQIIRILSETTILWLTLFLAKKIDSGKKSNLILILLIFFGMNIKMMRETILWVSGFWNYVIPPLMMLIYLYYVHKLFTDEKTNFSTIEAIICFIAGLGMNMFIEHSAIFSVILGVGAIIVIYILKRKIYNIEIFFLLGALIGLLIMFSSPTYTNPARLASATTFSSLTLLGKIKYNLLHSTFTSNLLFDNYMMNAIFTILFLKQRKKENKVYKVCSILFLLINIYIFAFYYVFLNYGFLTNLFSPKIQLLLFCIWNALFIIMIMTSTYKKNNKMLFWLMALYMSAIMSASPLIIITGFGPRCFYHSYILFMLLLINLKTYFNVNCKFTYKMTYIIFALLVSHRFFIFYSNYEIYKTRLEALNEASNKQSEVVFLESYPYPSYIHAEGEIWSEYHYGVFKKWYNLDGDTNIVLHQQNGSYVLIGPDGNRTPYLDDVTCSK